jgi:glycosyltransferase involved in cell wall biosynthesis
MKVAIAVQPWDRVVSKVGEGSSIAIIAYNLAHRLTSDHDVTIFANKGPGQAAQETDQQGIHFHRIKVSSKPFFQLADRLTGCWDMSPPLFATVRYYRSYALQVARMASEQKIEVLHLNTFFQHASIARKYNPDARIVLHMHDETMSLLPRELVRPHLKSIDCLIGVSDFVSNRFRARFPEYADKCLTIHNGVDPDRFFPLPGTNSLPEDSALMDSANMGSALTGSTLPNSSLAMPKASPQRILYVGRVSPEKGIHVLLSAFANVAEQYPGCELDIVGSPGLLPYVYHLGLTSDQPALGLKHYYGDSLFEKIRLQIVQKDSGYLSELRQLKTPAIAKRVHFHGSLPNEALLELYNNSSMLAFPSIWNEPFGMPITEAMACGLPVVSTKSGGIPEMVRHEETGLLVQRDDVQSLGDAMLRLLADKHLANKLAGSARSNVLNAYTFDHAATHLKACYKRLVES